MRILQYLPPYPLSPDYRLERRGSLERIFQLFLLLFSLSFIYRFQNKLIVIIELEAVRAIMLSFFVNMPFAFTQKIFHLTGVGQGNKIILPSDSAVVAFCFVISYWVYHCCL